MTLESIHPREGKHSTASSSTRSSRGRISRSTTRTPSPSSPLHEYLHHQEFFDADSDLASPEDSSSSTGGPSILGSVWNLFRDATGVAARELDKLLDHFPYKNTSRPSPTIETGADIQDRVMAVKKPRSLSSTLSASASVRPPKSLLGHGAHVKPRIPSSKHRQQALTTRLLDPELRNHVNNISPPIGASSTPTARSSGIMNRTSGTHARHHHHHASESDMYLERGRQPSHNAMSERDMDDRATSTKRSRDPSASDTERNPLHKSQPQLKRDSSYSSYSSFSSRPTHHEPIQDIEEPSSSGDEQQQGEDSDLSDYLSGRRRRRRLSREPSEAPSLSSMTGTLSISNSTRKHHRPHSRHSHSHDFDAHRVRKHVEFRSHSSAARYDYVEETPEPLEHDTMDMSLATYSNTLASRPKPPRKYGSRPLSSSSSSSPFVNGPAPADQWHIRSPAQPSQTEIDKLSELQQELAVIKEQLRSLVSAREGDLQRAQSSPAHTNSREPPPPPPGLSTPSPSGIMSKKWAPPQSQATRCMSDVLQELSSSKVQLRKTGSPFVSRISSAVDSSPSSEFTSVAIRSRSDLAMPAATTPSQNGPETPVRNGLQNRSSRGSEHPPVNKVS
ncbi:MAG: hypothetical protein J3Q66DRAFT_354230 [Benniella sp.]|nr:MAG: hypothetical protein J3Q66DRAFT_354230 [Benniella sp.]